MRKYLLFILAGLLLASCSGTRNLSKPELELPLRLAGNATDSVTLADVVEAICRFGSGVHNPRDSRA